MPTHRRPRFAPQLAIALCAGLLANPAAMAQPESSAAQVWRASSRLGYGPDAATALAAQGNPRAWALQQIDVAYAASQRAPSIAPELARFNQPLHQTVTEFQAERAARRLVSATTPVPGATDMANRAADNGNAFSREMQQTAAAWRLMA